MRIGFGSVGSALAAFVLSIGVAEGNDTSVGESSAAVWLAGNGDWSNAINWRGGMIPGIGFGAPDIYIDPQVRIDFDTSKLQENLNGDSISSTVTLSLNVNVGDMFLGLTDVLDIKSGGRVTFDSSVEQVIQVLNGGQISLGQSAAGARIIVGSGRTLALSGGGRMTLNHPTLAIIGGTFGSESIVNYAGVIDGAGLLGNGSLSIVNFGTIESNQQFRRLTVEPSSAGLTNAGTMRAANFSRLLLRNSVIDNTDGVIAAIQSSVVDLENTTINGGSIITDVDSAVRNLNAPAAMHNVSIAGNVEVGLTQLTLGGTITNDGVIVCTGDVTSRGGALPVNPSRIAIPSVGGTVLDGNGRIELIVGSVWSGQTGVHAQFTNGANHTIVGSGNIGNDTLCITNNGTIIADGMTPLILDPCDSSAFTNNGTLKAIGDGVLFLVDGAFQNYGTIEVAEGGQIILLPGAMLNNSLSGSLFGGKWIIRGSNDLAELILLTSTDFSINIADVTLDGPLSRFDRLNTLQFNLGSLELLNGRVFTSIGDFTNTATLHVDARSKLASPGKIALTSTSRVILEVSDDSNAKLQATSRATLGGVLEIVLAPGASWTPGRKLQFITGNQISGQFASVFAPGAFELSVVGGSVIIEPVGTCTGDLDLNSVVDVFDLLMLLDEWGNCPAAGPCTADLDASGVVNIFDLLQILGAFGNCP